VIISYWENSGGTCSAYISHNYSSSHIHPTVVQKSTIPTTSFNTTSTKAVVPTIPTAAIHVDPISSTDHRTTTIVIPTLSLSLQLLPITFHTITKLPYIIAIHQIVPLQRSLLVPKTLPIFLTTTYKLFDPGGIIFFDLQVDAIIFSQTRSPWFSLPPDLQSETGGGCQCSLCFPGFPYPL
jgi:hypothetical protein